MSGEPIGESFRELIELAAQENRRSNRLSKAAYAGFFGAIALGLTGGFFYSLSAGIGWGFWVAAAGALAASIFSAALNSRHHKKCAVTSRALIEKSQDQIDPNTIEPLQEGEFMGAYETLCCDESMVMMSRNRSFAVDIVIRIGSLLISIAAFGIIAVMIFHGGSQIFMRFKAVLLIGFAGLVGFLVAMRRVPVRWYASREELIIRIESVRWIFVREIEDVQIAQVDSVFLDNGTTGIQSSDGKIHVLQEITIPQLLGIKLKKDEQTKAEESIRQLQHTRILKSLDRVFPGYIIVPDPETA